MKERITENGIDYVLVGDYYIPDSQSQILCRSAVTHWMPPGSNS